MGETSDCLKYSVAFVVDGKANVVIKMYNEQGKNKIEKNPNDKNAASYQFVPQQSSMKTE